MLKKAVASIVGAGLVMCGVQAFAGEWRLNPRACPDVVEDRYDHREDRRDTRADYGRGDRVEDRYDRHENRRDRAVTICPVRAFYYQPDRNELRRAQRAGGHPGRYAWNRANFRPQFSYDRKLRLYYRYADGRKIYVRV
jgi:hypothetical protein